MKHLTFDIIHHLSSSRKRESGFSIGVENDTSQGFGKKVNCHLSLPARERDFVTCQKGFTLLEILIGFAIFGLISTLVAAVYFAQFRLFTSQNASIEIASQNKLALDEITNQIRESQAVVASCCGAETTSSNGLVIRVWPKDANGEPVDPLGAAYDYIIYRRDSTDNTLLIKKIVADPVSSRLSGENIIANSVSNLQFTYDNADPTLAGQVTISLTNSQVSGSKTHTITQTASAVLRNK